MFAFFKKLFSPSATLSALESRVLELEGALQGAKLELAEKKEELLQTQKNLEQAQNDLQQAQRDLQRQAAKQESTIQTIVAGQIELLIKDAASPVAQLLTQSHLLSVDGRELQAKDLMQVALRLIRCLEDAGMESEGSIGNHISFDSSRHQLIGENTELAEGSEVIIRMPAILLKGQILHKMMVQAALNETASSAQKQEAL